MVGAKDEDDRRAGEWAAQQFAGFYHRAVVAAVGATWNPPPQGRWLQLIVAPPFEPEIVLTATETDGGCRVVANTVGCCVCRFLPYFDADRWSADDAVLPRTRHMSLEGEMDLRASALLWSAAGTVKPPPPSPLMTLDGIEISVRYRLASTVVEIDSCCPSRHSPEAALFDLLITSIAIPEDHLVFFAAAAVEPWLT